MKSRIRETKRIRLKYKLIFSPIIMVYLIMTVSLILDATVLRKQDISPGFE